MHAAAFSSGYLGLGAEASSGACLSLLGWLRKTPDSGGFNRPALYVFIKILCLKNMLTKSAIRLTPLIFVNYLAMLSRGFPAN